MPISISKLYSIACKTLLKQLLYVIIKVNSSIKQNYNGCRHMFYICKYCFNNFLKWIVRKKEWFALWLIIQTYCIFVPSVCIWLFKHCTSTDISHFSENAVESIFIYYCHDNSRRYWHGNVHDNLNVWWNRSATVLLLRQSKNRVDCAN